MRTGKQILLFLASVFLSAMFYYTAGGLPIRDQNISSTLGPGTYEAPFVIGIGTWAICPLRREGDTLYRLNLMHGTGTRMYTPYSGALKVIAPSPKAGQTP